MLDMTESRITIEIPIEDAMDGFAKNMTMLMTELEELNSRQGDASDDKKLVTDVWVGVVLTLLVLSCAACMCSCLLYHRFQLWKRREMEARARANAELAASGGDGCDGESLPSYTIVSGLPSYEEALRQLDKARACALRMPTPARLSVDDLLKLYRQPDRNELKS